MAIFHSERIRYLAGLVCTFWLAGLALTAAQAIPARAVGETVQAYLTSNNGAYNLSYQSLQFEAQNTSSAANYINVDPGTTYQTMDGIGGSLDHLSVYHLMRMNASTRQSVIEKLFDPVNGIGYNWIRIAFGTSDASLGSYYTYADTRGPDSDPLAYFSIQPDIDRGILDVIHSARSYNPDLRVVASSWTPPAWMKSDPSVGVAGGTFGSGNVGLLAQYFRRAISEYQSRGIPIYALTMQNEPGVVVNYPSMQLGEFQEGQLVLSLHDEFSQNNIGTKLWIYDQTYSSSQYYVDPLLDRTSYPNANPYVDGIAYHDYEGDVGEMSRVHNKYPGKGIHITEKSTGPGVETATSMIKTFRNYAQSWLDWVTVSDETGANNGPYVLGGFVQNSSSDANAINYTTGYYMMGQFTKFVKRGAVRLGSSEGSPDNITNVAFRNPNGDIVLVVVNQSSTTQSFKVTSPQGQFISDLPDHTMATYVWPGGSSGGGGSALDRNGWQASASSSPTDPCCTSDQPNNVLDNNTYTRWSSGQGQSYGQYFQLDMQSVRSFNKITLDAGGSSGDYPRGYEVYVSNDPNNFSSQVASGSGGGSLVTITFGSQSARYIRIVQTGSAGNWWSISELNVFN